MFQKCFLIICCFMTFVFANGFTENQNLGCSVYKIQEDKVYLKPGTIQIAKNGIFINVGGQLRSVNHLHMDEEGVYFEVSKDAPYGYCPICRCPLFWGMCMNPNCPTNG